MEFFLGSVFTLVLISVIRSLILKSNVLNDNAPMRIFYSQSYVHSLVGQRVADLIYPPEPKRTQSRELIPKNSIRVIFADNYAYWIKDNKFYQAVVVNGEIDNSTTKVVDTMGMSKVELDKMFFIVQKLTEGKNHDGRNPGVTDL